MKNLILYSIVFVATIQFSLSKDLSQTDTTKFQQSPYSLGLSCGYTGLFVGSPVTESTYEKDFVNGLSFGIVFEYRFEGTKASLQFLSESNQMNIKFDERNQDSIKYSSFNLLGIKAFLGFAKGLYILPAAGIITGVETQFIKSISLGYEFTGNMKKSASYFYQIGYSFTDYKDGYLMVRMGIRINL